MKIYLVGGAVRDEILGLKANDLDYVVVDSSIEEMLSLGFKKVGNDFPVFIHPTSGEEYALARKEKKNGAGYKGFETEWENVTLAEDLKRRDLTINAIAKNLETGELIDPYGGIKDLEDKVIRHVSKHFSEDPLRVLRAARFAARFKFSINEQTVALCAKIASSGDLDSLTPELVWRELRKVLSLEDPTYFFEFLLQVGALKRFFPELSQLEGIPQNVKYHPEGDAWIHTMLVLKESCKKSEKIEVRFAALVHDLGKGETPSEILPAHHKHETTGIPLVDNVCRRFKVDNASKKLALAVCEHHLRVHRCLESRPGKLLALLKNLKAFKSEEFFNDALICCEADNSGKLSTVYEQSRFLKYLASELVKMDTSELIQKFKGSELGEKIEQFQMNRIKKLSVSFKKENSLSE